MLRSVKWATLVLAITAMLGGEVFAQRGRGGGGGGGRSFSGGRPSGMGQGRTSGRSFSGGGMRSGGFSGGAMRGGGFSGGAMRGGSSFSGGAMRGGSSFSGGAMRGGSAFSGARSAPGISSVRPSISGRSGIAGGGATVRGAAPSVRSGSPSGVRSGSPSGVRSGSGIAGTSPSAIRGGSSFSGGRPSGIGQGRTSGRSGVPGGGGAVQSPQAGGFSRGAADRSRGPALGQRQVGNPAQSAWADRGGRTSGRLGNTVDGSATGRTGGQFSGGDRGALDRSGRTSGRSGVPAGIDGSGRTSARSGAVAGVDGSGRGRQFGPSDRIGRGGTDGRQWSGSGRGTDGRQWSGSGRGDWAQRGDGRRSGAWSDLAAHRGGRNFAGVRGDRHWSGRFHDRHRHWHRGFGVNVFLGSPWGWSPWWGGWGGGFGLGWGGGFGGLGFGGLGFGGMGFGGMGGFGGWGGWGGFGWDDWWGPWGYAPLAFQSGYWNYVNPYWHEPLVLGSTVIDYSQPIILLDDPGQQVEAVDDDPAVTAALTQFDAARELFRRGDYQSALHRARRAMEHLPADAALHEFVALVHFARGEYRQAAGTIHSVLAAGPGWSWETMRGLYPDVATYTEHLRAAEAHRRANPDSADVRFLLAYHYMTTGYADAAANELRQVLQLEPNDALSGQLLQAISGEPEAPGAQPSPQPGAQPAEADAPRLVRPQGEAGERGTPPQAEALVGSWSAGRDDGSKFSLNLGDDGRFTWTFSHRDQTNELTGKYTMADDLLILESEQGGAMIGRVSETGENQFQFRLLGSPESDPGLTFAK